MTFLDWASTSPVIRFAASKYDAPYCNPNAAYAYKERKMLMDCEERIKAAIGAKGGHVLYFRCATDALEWLVEKTYELDPIRDFAHSPYEHDAAVYGMCAMPDELDEMEFYCHQLVNQITGQIHDIKAVHKQLLRYDDVPFLICDCTAAMGKVGLRATKVCQYADAIVTSGHKIGCPDLSFVWLNDGLCEWLGAAKDIRNQWGLHHGSLSVASVLALTDAVEWACDEDRVWNGELKFVCLVDDFFDGLDDIAEFIGGDMVGTLAINAIRLNGINADALQQFLASRGIYVGVGGSACSAAHDYRVLRNGYGLNNDEAAEVIRVSLGPETTADDIKALVDGVKEYRRQFC